MEPTKIASRLVAGLAAALGALAFLPAGAGAEIRGEEKAVLTDPPEVPAPIARDHATKVIVELEVRELVDDISDGVQYTFWTFGGTVPGSFIRVREGDLVEFHMRNHPDNTVPHNIDLHAVTGPGGGATSSFVAPGQEAVFSFQVLNPGLYVYHCATAPVGMHIANGMYGLILVEPEEGLPEVDRELYVMQGDFYTEGRYGDPGLQPFSMEKALEENPDYVLFNGSVGAISGDNAIPAQVGDRVRIYFGNGGPNLVSSFHVIGEIFDEVRVEAGSLINRDVQTTLVPAGGAAIVDFALEVPGTFILVDHSIFRAFNKGAIGMIRAGGAENELIYSGRQDERIYLPEGGAIGAHPGEAPAPRVAASKQERIAEGQRIYQANCMACHQGQGQGIPRAFPPLAKSDYLNADVDRAIEIVAEGLSGRITVNDVDYDTVMPRLGLSHEQIANVLTYVLNQWGNSGGEVTPDRVAEVLTGP